MSQGTVSRLESLKIESRSRERRSIKTEFVVRGQAKLTRGQMELQGHRIERVWWNQNNYCPLQWVLSISSLVSPSLLDSGPERQEPHEQVLFRVPGFEGIMSGWPQRRVKWWTGSIPTRESLAEKNQRLLNLKEPLNYSMCVKAMVGKQELDITSPLWKACMDLHPHVQSPAHCLSQFPLTEPHVTFYEAMTNVGVLCAIKVFTKDSVLKHRTNVWVARRKKRWNTIFSSGHCVSE